jgi:hypothetical protein
VVDSLGFDGPWICLRHESEDFALPNENCKGQRYRKRPNCCFAIREGRGIASVFDARGHRRINRLFRSERLSALIDMQEPGVGASQSFSRNLSERKFNEAIERLIACVATPRQRVLHVRCSIR